MDNPYRIRLSASGGWEVYRKKTGVPSPGSRGTKTHALSHMAALLHVTLKELRQAARAGTLNPTVT